MSAKGKITPDMRAAMVRAYAEGKRQQDIAAAFGISQGMVSKVVGLRQHERSAAVAPCRFCGCSGALRRVA